MNKFHRNITQNSFLIVVIFNFIFLTLYIGFFSGGLSDNNSDWGSFGSFIGGIMAPIVGVLTIILTYSILNNQNKEFSQSEFRFMFEKLFNSINDQYELIQFEKGDQTFKGKEAIKRLNSDFFAVTEYLIRKEKEKEDREEKQAIKYQPIVSKAFWSVYDDVNGCFATYMKNIHNCLKVIDLYCDQNHKETYSDLLRAQLGKEEMKFILYNGSSFNDFKNRIEKYAILQDIRNTDEVNENVLKIYENKAFGQ